VLLFHRIIQDDLLPEETPIDVVSYRHVHKGPWVILLCTDGLYVFDGSGGRPGLKYISRASADLQLVIDRVTAMAAVIERELKLVFLHDEVELELPDRRTYPNTREGFALATSHLAKQLGEVFDDAEIAWSGAADLLGPMRIVSKLRSYRVRAIDRGSKAGDLS